jgi:deazaflavin-dependent oxidoreductase (nitroreductase family)
VSSPNDWNEWNAAIIEEFRANEGRVGGMFEGETLPLLHHTGAKSGVERVTPLVYQAVGDRYAVFASNAGAAHHPAWYHNLVAHPRTRVEVGPATIEVSARVADDTERGPIWERQKAHAPGFAEFESATARQIPVGLLEHLTPAE